MPTVIRPFASLRSGTVTLLGESWTSLSLQNVYFHVEISSYVLAFVSMLSLENLVYFPIKIRVDGSQRQREADTIFAVPTAPRCYQRLGSAE